MDICTKWNSQWNTSQVDVKKDKGEIREELTQDQKWKK